jgi:hypothetical protein
MHVSLGSSGLLFMRAWCLVALGLIYRHHYISPSRGCFTVMRAILTGFIFEDEGCVTVFLSNMD